MTHLVAVGTESGFVGMFDIEARRVFCKVHEPMGDKQSGSKSALRLDDKFPKALLGASGPKQACMLAL